MPTDPMLLSILVCPVTRTRLIYDEKAEELISDVAGLAYPIRNGIPIMLVTEARALNEPKDTHISN
ncbi:MAG: Trm112 family protein [Pseudomonadota bacterium]